MKKPIIGITIDYANNDENNSFSPYPWYALKTRYSDLVSEFGGVPLLLPYNFDVTRLSGLIDGLLIPGGSDDIHPKFYGQEIQSERVNAKENKSFFELEITKSALNFDIPIFGICNGMQIINVALGGTLIQHIPDTHPSDINHEQPAPKNLPTHKIILEKKSLLSSLYKSGELMVNSTHHQAVADLGRSINVSCIAPDGIIEGIESTNHRFVVGVQWHAEHLNMELDRELFKKFIEESSK